jgi:hypothetical protein
MASLRLDPSTARRSSQQQEHDRLHREVHQPYRMLTRRSANAFAYRWTRLALGNTSAHSRGLPRLSLPSPAVISGNGPALRVAWWCRRYLAASRPSPAVAALGCSGLADGWPASRRGSQLNVPLAGSLGRVDGACRRARRARRAWRARRSSSAFICISLIRSAASCRLMTGCMISSWCFLRGQPGGRRRAMVNLDRGGVPRSGTARGRVP